MSVRHLAYAADTLPSREGMRTPHKSRHAAARFTTRNGRRGTGAEAVGR